MTGFLGTGYGYGGGLGLGGYGLGNYGTRNCLCNFPTLIILILIVLQFSRCGKDSCDRDSGCKPVGNGILFIVALFFLSCVGCGRGSSY